MSTSSSGVFLSTEDPVWYLQSATARYGGRRRAEMLFHIRKTGRSQSTASPSPATSITGCSNHGQKTSHRITRLRRKRADAWIKRWNWGRGILSCSPATTCSGRSEMDISGGSILSMMPNVTLSGMHGVEDVASVELFRSLQHQLQPVRIVTAARKGETHMFEAAGSNINRR